MTTHARVVLADRRDAHADLVDGLQGSDWRRRWTTVVVLLRTVLHILHKVDAERDPEVRSAVQAVWLDLKASKPEPATLWCFIEEDRNSILEEYVHRAGQSVGVLVGAGRAETSYDMNSGRFSGEDPRQVATSAIDWLESVPNDVDAPSATRQP
jgi:hypothetical protein